MSIGGGWHITVSQLLEGCTRKQVVGRVREQAEWRLSGNPGLSRQCSCCIGRQGRSGLLDGKDSRRHGFNLWRLRDGWRCFDSGHNRKTKTIKERQAKQELLARQVREAQLKRQAQQPEQPGVTAATAETISAPNECSLAALFKVMIKCSNCTTQFEGGDKCPACEAIVTDNVGEPQSAA